MRVNVLKGHSNDFPPTFIKVVGDIYELPDAIATRLIKRGKVEAADEGQGGRVQGRRTGASRTANGNGQKRPAAGGKGRAGADGKRRGKKGA